MEPVGRTFGVGESFVPAPHWPADGERAVVRRLDWRVVPVAWCLYFCANLDRGALGNAKVLNSGTDGSIEAVWGLEGVQYNWIISICSIGIAVCEPWSNVVLRYLGPRKWFARIMLTWGIIAACQAAVTNFAGAMVARFFLGCAEAGVFSGVPFYLAVWFTQAERTRRLAYSYTGHQLASAVGGFIAIGVQYMDGMGGLYSWQWLFILEGIVPIIASVFFFFFVPENPDDAPFLSEEQRRIAVDRLPPTAPRRDEPLSWAEARRELADPVLWMFTAVVTLFATAATGQSSLQPSIVQGIGVGGGKNSVAANGYSAMINLCQAAAAIIVSWSCDRTGDRYWHGLAAFWSCVLVGYLPLAITSLRPSSVPPQLRLFFLVVLNCCSTATFITKVTYRVNTGRGATSTAVGTAAIFTGQAVAQVIGPFLYPNSAAPTYTWGLFAGMGLAASAGTVWAFIPFAIRRRDARGGSAVLVESAEEEAAVVAEKAADPAKVDVDVKA
ncbi:major facilitator superfamily domain-containing protein [Hyaloraphidium curvatum]|nr:major facilitator superfamily domain-containing protein [Hyaloraphidium curvatum]